MFIYRGCIHVTVSCVMDCTAVIMQEKTVYPVSPMWWTGGDHGPLSSTLSGLTTSQIHHSAQDKNTPGTLLSTQK